MKKRYIQAIFIIVLSVILSIVLIPKTPKYSQIQFFALDTFIDIRIEKSQKSDAIVQKCKDAVLYYDKLFNCYDENSDIYKINSNAGKSFLTAVNDDTIKIIQSAVDFSCETDGLFDITSGALIDLWDINSDMPKVPDKTSIEKAKKSVSYRDVYIDTDTSSISLKNPEQKINLGAVAKGYICDRIANILREENIKSAIINLGGNTYCLGQKGQNSWRIAIAHPKVEDKLLCTINLSDQSAVTSGDYERFFEYDGVRYHHILNPDTGYPADSGLHSVTIICDSSLNADMLSTACFILGYEKSIPLLEKYNAKAIFYTYDDEILTFGDIEISE